MDQNVFRIDMFWCEKELAVLIVPHFRYTLQKVEPSVFTVAIKKTTPASIQTSLGAFIRHWAKMSPHASWTVKLWHGTRRNSISYHSKFLAHAKERWQFCFDVIVQRSFCKGIPRNFSTHTFQMQSLWSYLFQCLWCSVIADNSQFAKLFILHKDNIYFFLHFLKYLPYRIFSDKKV